MTGRSRALACIAVAGVIVGLIALWAALAGEGTSNPGALLTRAGSTRAAEAFPPLVLTIGWGFIGAGLFAALRRPDNRIGALMTAVGFAWLVASLSSSNEPLPLTVGLLARTSWGGFLVHMMLAFPSGRLQTATERAIVAAGYLMTTVLHVAPLLFTADNRPHCGECADNLAAVASQPALAQALYTVELLAIVGVVSLTCAVLARRWGTASAPQRRALAPVLGAGGSTGALVVLSAATESAHLYGLSDAVDWAYLAAFASVPFAFLAGLLRSRLRRVDAVSELVARLADAPETGQLRSALADALGDPSLALAYWLSEHERYVDATGRAVELPAEGSGQVATEIEHQGRRIATIVHDASLCEEPGLVRAAGSAAAISLENERLDAELRARLEELRSSREQIVRAREEERRRLRRDLHDGVGAALAGIILRLGAGQARLDGHAPSQELVSGVEGDLRDLTAEVRLLIDDLRPPALDELGLLRALGEQAIRLSPESRPSVEIEAEPLDGEESLPAAVEVAAYRIATEAMTNVVRHAGASRCSVKIRRTHRALELEVSDDGAGLPAAPREGVGLTGIRERVTELGGSCAWAPGPAGGTRFFCQLPLGSA